MSCWLILVLGQLCAEKDFSGVMKKLSSKFRKGALTIYYYSFFGEFCRHFVKTWNGWINLSSFNTCPSLPSVATDDRKQFQWLNKDFNNKTGPLFLIFKWCEKNFSFQKERQWRGIASLSSNSSLYKWCIEFRTSHESFFIMQVFPDQASHRDLALFEFKLSSVKAITCPFPWYKVGLAVLPPPPHLSLRFVLIMSEMIWILWNMALLRTCDIIQNGCHLGLHENSDLCKQNRN